MRALFLISLSSTILFGSFLRASQEKLSPLFSNHQEEDVKTFVEQTQTQKNNQSPTILLSRFLHKPEEVQKWLLYAQEEDRRISIEQSQTRRKGPLEIVSSPTNLRHFLNSMEFKHKDPKEKFYFIQDRLLQDLVTRQITLATNTQGLDIEKLKEPPTEYLNEFARAINNVIIDYNQLYFNELAERLNMKKAINSNK